MDELSKMMHSMSDKDIVKICIKAQADPATIKNIVNLRKATPESKICPPDFKTPSNNVAVPKTAK